MPDELTISSINDLQPAIDRLLDNPEVEFCPVVTAGFAISITLKGKTWDGLVDVRVAKYVTELQAAHDRIRRECGIDASDRPLVKIRVKEGSTELVSEIAKITSDSLARMTSNQQFIILLTSLGVLFVGWSLKQVLAHLADRQKVKLEHESTTGTVRDLNSTLRLALEKIDPEKPTRTLVNRMQEDDSLILPAVTTPLTRDQAKARYPRKPRITPVDVLIDDNYDVDSVSLEVPVRLSLTRGDVSFRADFSAKLAPEDKGTFLQKIKSSIEVGGSTRVALQVNATIGERSITSAVIVGIGRAPRDGAEDVTTLLD